MDHSIEKHGELYHCTTCDITLKIDTALLPLQRSKFAQALAQCPGIPIYGYEEIPQTLANKSWFGQQSLEPTGEPVACYLNRTESLPAYILLYEKAQCTPKAKKRPSLKTVNRAIRASGSPIRLVIDKKQ